MTRPKTLFTIVEGGERTYVHPYSYSEESINKILFLDTPECPVDQKFTQNNFMYKYEASLFRKGWDIVRRIWKTARKCGHYRNWSIYWNSTVPVYGLDIYRESSISVPGTLLPSDPGQNLTDTCYLIPSQEWIKRKLGEWLTAPNRSDVTASITDTKTGKVTSFHDYERNSYLTWADSQVKLGRKIAFITSLDT